MPQTSHIAIKLDKLVGSIIKDIKQGSWRNGEIGAFLNQHVRAQKIVKGVGERTQMGVFYHGITIMKQENFAGGFARDAI